MLIEFCSPPGAGKTWVYRALLKARSTERIECDFASDMRRLDARALRLKRSIALRVPMVQRQLKHYCGSKCRFGAGRLMRALLRDIQHVTWWQTHGGGRPVLFDEAIGQRFLSLCMRSSEAPEALLPSYLQLTPGLDAIVTVDVPVEKALTRMRDRSEGTPLFMSRMSDEETLRTLQISERACSAFVQHAERRGAMVIRCNGEEPPQVSARKIIDSIPLRKLLHAA
jgi:hypothetical protein